MSPYLPPLDIGRPTLVEHLAFWRHCAQGELRFQRCDGCAVWRHPPSPLCPRCGSTQARWALASNDAELFSYTVVHHAASAALQHAVPYNIAIVAFPSLGMLRLVSNVIDATPEQLRIGMALELVWQRVDAGRQLPLFKRVHRAADEPA